MDQARDKITLNLEVADRDEFRRRELGYVYRETFSLGVRPELEVDSEVDVDLVLGNGEVLLSGTVRVVDVRIDADGGSEAMAQLIDLRTGELELQPEFWAQQAGEPATQEQPVPSWLEQPDPELATQEQPDPELATQEQPVPGWLEQPDPEPATQEPPAPAPQPPEPGPVEPALPPSIQSGTGAKTKLIVAAVGVATLGIVLALVALGGTDEDEQAAPAPTEPEKKTDPIADKLQLADQRIEEGRVVGPGGDTALDLLLQVREESPQHPRMLMRIKEIADRYEKLGDRAFLQGSLEEAATHYQVVIKAAPERKYVRARLKEIEAQIHSRAEAALDGGTPD